MARHMNFPGESTTGTPYEVRDERGNWLTDKKGDRIVVQLQPAPAPNAINDATGQKRYVEVGTGTRYQSCQAGQGVQVA